MTKHGGKKSSGKFPRNHRVRQQWHLCSEPLTTRQSQLISGGAVKWRRESCQNVKYAAAVLRTNSSILSFVPAQDSLKQDTLIWVKEEIYISEKEQIICEPVIHKPVIHETVIILFKKLAIYKIVLDTGSSGVDSQWCDALVSLELTGRWGW